jgi:hypothetical protein
MNMKHILIITGCDSSALLDGCLYNGCPCFVIDSLDKVRINFL